MSAPTSSEVSLNEILHKGPTIQNFSFIIHLRFRTYEIVVMGDIEKMYLQVRVREEDRKFQRAVWFDGERVIILQSNTLTFGEISAPFLAICCLHQLTREHESTLPLSADAIKYDTYVDNVATGSRTVNEAIELRKQITMILKNGGFHIRQWSSDRSGVLRGLAKDEIDSELDLSGENTLNMLGVWWNAKRDCYVYSVEKMIVLKGTRITK